MRPWHGYKSARTRAAPRSLCASVSAHGKARSRLKMRPAEKFRALVNTVGPKRALEVSGIGGTVTGDGWGVPGRSHRQLDRRRTQVSRGIQALADGDPDLRRCDSAIPFLHGRGDGLGLGVGTVVSSQCRRLPVHVGNCSRRWSPARVPCRPSVHRAAGPSSSRGSRRWCGS